jgi:outer membrane lipoprotein LolB
MNWRLVLFALAMLGGCAMSPPRPVSVARPADAVSAPFALNGRVSIKQLEERHSAGLHWKHQAQSDEILLLTPLGQTAARVYRDDGHATLDEGGKHYQDVDVESLMQQVLGWHLPLGGLHYWVLGKADPAVPAQIERDGNGRISVLRQDGWEVRFLHYADREPADIARCGQSPGCAGDDQGANSLPTRLQLSHEDMQVQLLIDEWDWDPQ